MLAKKSLTLASLFTVLGLLMASCAPAAAPTPTAKAAAPTVAATSAPVSPSTPKPAAPAASPKPATDQPRYGGVLTIGVGGDPPSLDVHREETGFNFAITSGTYNGLVKYDPRAWPELKVISDLATSWQLSPDGKVYTFSLVKGAKFHDGSPLTAEDVKFSLDRIWDPEAGLARSPRRQQVAAISRIETPDDNTVRVTLSRPQAPFLSFIAASYYAVMPKRVVLDKKGDMTKTIVGSGPFKFKDYAVGTGWELVKNSDYFVKGLPYLDGVKGYIISDPFTRFAALRTGNVLFWGPLPYMTTSQAKVIANTLSDKITVKWAFHPAWYGVIFNVNRPPWSDVRVRQAVSLAIDRKNMLELGLEGGGTVGMSAQPPGEWALPEEEMMKVPGYAKPDVEGAKKLLAEAGFPNGLKTEALVWSQPAQRKLGEIARDAMAPLGITVDLNLQETAVYMDQRFRKAFNILIGSSGAGHSDPDIMLGDYYVSGAPVNFPGYSNPQYDELFAKESQTLDAAERRKIVWEMQRILLKDVPIAVAYWSNVAYAWWNQVRGYNPTSLSHYHAFMYSEMWLAR